MVIFFRTEMYYTSIIYIVFIEGKLDLTVMKKKQKKENI